MGTMPQQQWQQMQLGKGCLPALCPQPSQTARQQQTWDQQTASAGEKLRSPSRPRAGIGTETAAGTRVPTEKQTGTVTGTGTEAGTTEISTAAETATETGTSTGTGRRQVPTQTGSPGERGTAASSQRPAEEVRLQSHLVSQRQQRQRSLLLSGSQALTFRSALAVLLHIEGCTGCISAAVNLMHQLASSLSDHHAGCAEYRNAW